MHSDTVSLCHWSTHCQQAGPCQFCRKLCVKQNHHLFGCAPIVDTCMHREVSSCQISCESDQSVNNINKKKEKGKSQSRAKLDVYHKGRQARLRHGCLFRHGLPQTPLCCLICRAFLQCTCMNFASSCRLYQIQMCHTLAIILDAQYTTSKRHVHCICVMGNLWTRGNTQVTRSKYAVQ